MPEPRPPEREGPIPEEFRIDALAFGGEGIARRDGKVCFIPGALPGERVLAVPASRRRRFDRFRLLRVLEPAPERRPPLCPHTSLCGGCVLQELEYEAQLRAKAGQVRDCLERIGGVTSPEFGPPLASPVRVAYRNKMEFTFAPRPWLAEGRPVAPPPGPALGLHVPGRFDAVFDVERCVLPSPEAVVIAQAVREFARAERLPAWRSDDDSGLLRHLIVRQGMRTGEILAGLVARDEHPAFAALGPLLEERLRAVAREGDASAEPASALGPPPPSTLAGLVLIVNRKLAAVARGEEEILLHGRRFFRERLAGLEFELSAQSFFQTNTLGAERLVEAIRASLGSRTTGALLDLYCGAGTLGLALAGSFQTVLGVEESGAAVADARRNAERNGIRHARFLEARVEEWIERAAQPPRGDADTLPEGAGVLVDPPRVGLHPRAVRGILGLRAPWILYVSCNPSTLARDATLLVEGGYRAVHHQVVDLFPHTAHVETVLLLERAG